MYRATRCAQAELNPSRTSRTPYLPLPACSAHMYPRDVGSLSRRRCSRARCVRGWVGLGGWATYLVGRRVSERRRERMSGDSEELMRASWLLRRLPPLALPPTASATTMPTARLPTLRFAAFAVSFGSAGTRAASAATLATVALPLITHTHVDGPSVYHLPALHPRRSALTSPSSSREVHGTVRTHASRFQCI